MASVSIERPPSDYETPGNPAAFSPSPHFQLYIKLLDGVGLKRTGVEAVDSVVEMILERGGREVVKKSSRVFKLDENPSWNEEWIVTKVESGAGGLRMRFCVYDYRRILSNVLLGEAVYDVSALAEGEMKELWLELGRGGKSESGKIETAGDPSEASEVPKIRVLVHKTGVKAGEKDGREEARMEMKRLSSLRVVLEKLSYYPGERVRGMVISNIGSEKRMRGLRLHAIGQSTVRWVERHGQHHSKHYFATHSLFDETLTLFGNGRVKSEGEAVKVEKKNFCFPFSFTLPAHIPPSFKGANGFIQYRLTAYCDLRFTSNKCATMPFTVYNQFHSSIPHALVANSGPETHTLLRKNVMEIPLSISAPVVVEPGQSIPVSICVNRTSHPSGSPIVAISVELCQLSRYKAACGASWKERPLRRVVCASYFGTKAPSTAKHTFKSLSGRVLPPNCLLPINGGQERRFKVFLDIPLRTPPTIFPQLSPILEVTYTIEVTLQTEGSFLTYAANQKGLPIVISTSQPLPATFYLTHPEHTKVFGEGIATVDGSGARDTTEKASLSGFFNPPHFNALIEIEKGNELSMPPEQPEALTQLEEDLKTFELENNGDAGFLVQGHPVDSKDSNNTPGDPEPQQRSGGNGGFLQNTVLGALAGSTPSPSTPTPAENTTSPLAHDSEAISAATSNIEANQKVEIPNQASHPSPADSVLMTPSSHPKGLYGEPIPLPAIVASQQVVLMQNTGSDLSASPPSLPALFSMPTDAKTNFVINPQLVVLPDAGQRRWIERITPPASIPSLSSLLIQHTIFYHHTPSTVVSVDNSSQNGDNSKSGALPASPASPTAPATHATDAVIQEYLVPLEYNTPFFVTDDPSFARDDDSNSPPSPAPPASKPTSNPQLQSAAKGGSGNEGTATEGSEKLALAPPSYDSVLASSASPTALYPPSAINFRIYRPSMLVPTFNGYMAPPPAVSSSSLLPSLSSSLPIFETLDVASCAIPISHGDGVASSSNAASSPSSSSPPSS